MANIEPIEIVQRLIAIVLAAIVTSWCWLIFRLYRGEPILPERPLVERRPVPWKFGTILLVFFIFVSVSSIGVMLYSGVAHLLPGRHDPAPLSDMMTLDGAIKILLLALLPWVVWKTSGGRFADFGLSFRDAGRQAVCGVVAVLIAAPPIYAIQAGAAKIWEPVEHPLSKMIVDEFSVGVGFLAVITAVVLAPLFEELLFRGLLQSWLITALGRRSGSLGTTGTDDQSVEGISATSKSVAADWDPELEAASPRAGTLSELTGPVEPPDRRWLGIVLTSILFAYVHAPQWPAPIALFVLALVIGTVYYRTGSLITAVCMHATFNGMSTLMLFAMVVAGHKVEPDKVTGPPRPGLSRSHERGQLGLPVARSARPKL